MDGQMYVLVESTYYLPKRPQTRYGVALMDCDNMTDTIVQTVCDVSTDRRFVEKIVVMCNMTRPTTDKFKELIVEGIG